MTSSICNIMLHFLFECPCFGYGPRAKLHETPVLVGVSSGERRRARKPAVGLLADSAQRRAFGHWQKQAAGTPGDALGDASHLDGVNCYKAFSTDDATPVVKLSLLLTGMVLRSRMSMVTLPLVITKP